MQKTKALMTTALLAALAGIYACGGSSSSNPGPVDGTGGDPDPTVIGGKTWSTETVYDHIIHYPSSMAADPSGNIYVYSTGDKKIVKYDGSSFSEYYDASSLQEVRAMAWQPGNDRLIFSTSGGKFYSYNGTSLATLSTSTDAAQVSAIVVDSRSDEFYTCSMTRGGSVNRWFSTGLKNAANATSVDGCFSITLDQSNNTLYYSETYDGEVNSIGISVFSGTPTVVASGIGISDTSEPITVGMDGSGNLYYFTANQGLYKYVSGTTWTKTADAVTGAGPMVWDEDSGSFIVAQGAGANLVAYNITTGLASNLTRYVNATGLAEMDDGTVLACDQNFGEKIKKVTSSGFADFATTTGATCASLERDTGGNIYAGMTDGSVWKVASDGTASSWASGFTTKQIIRMAWDEKNSRLLLTAGADGDATASLYGIPSGDPSAAALVKSFSATVSSAVPVVAADGSGNIYILERSANKIYKMADGSTDLKEWASSVLPSEAVTVPDMEYISNESGLLVTNINGIDLWNSSAVKSTFHTNESGVDNFAVNENKNGDVIAIHSGKVFRFVYN